MEIQGDPMQLFATATIATIVSVLYVPTLWAGPGHAHPDPDSDPQPLTERSTLEQEAEEPTETETAPASRRTTHSLTLGVNFGTLGVRATNLRQHEVEHIDPMIGYALHHCWSENGCATPSIALGANVYEGGPISPVYMAGVELHFEKPHIWVSLEMEGHLEIEGDEEEDEETDAEEEEEEHHEGKIHTHFPNTLVGGGAVLPRHVHLGVGIDFFYGGELIRYTAGPALMLGWDYKNAHLHGHVSAGVLSGHPGVLIARMSIHLTLALN